MMDIYFVVWLFFKIIFFEKLFQECHQSVKQLESRSLAHLVMPNGDPRDGFLYPTLTLMMGSYDIFGKEKRGK